MTYLEDRPWGSFNVLLDASDFKVKVLRVHSNGILSLQSHEYRDEHWVVVQGEGRVVQGDEVLEVRRGSYVYVPRGLKHRIMNPYSSTLVLVEVQTGEYLGEDDIVRFEDQYGR